MESRATQQRGWRRAGTPTTHEHIVEGSAKFAAPLVANLLHVCGRAAPALHGPQGAIGGAAAAPRRQARERRDTMCLGFKRDQEGKVKALRGMPMSSRSLLAMY